MLAGSWVLESKLANTLARNQRAHVHDHIMWHCGNKATKEHPHHGFGDQVRT